MCAKFGCGPTVVSKKKGGGGTDRQRELLLYIVDILQAYIVLCMLHTVAKLANDLNWVK